MKCAVLCNGPSRDVYTGDTQYEYVVGCNSPWTRVDATVVLDESMIDAWYKNRSLITVPVYFSKHSFAYACTLDQPFFSQYLLQEVVPESNHHSSGHVALEILLEKGYQEIDVYGCDSWYRKDASSYTRNIIPLDSPNREIRDHGKLIGWKARWQDIIDKHPSVNINFIK